MQLLFLIYIFVNQGKCNHVYVTLAFYYNNQWDRKLRVKVRLIASQVKENVHLKTLGESRKIWIFLVGNKVPHNYQEIYIKITSYTL